MIGAAPLAHASSRVTFSRICNGRPRASVFIFRLVHFASHTDLVTTPPVENDLALLDRLAEARRELATQIGKRIVGQTQVVDDLVTALLAGGHVVLVGVPGLAKTLLVQTVAQALDLTFSRVQFTPDLMPSDITGTELMEEEPGTGKRTFRFTEGPVFANMVLADEINRAPPKTQAALLQAMQERTVTVAGRTYELPKPFFVLATQNPIEQEGTYPLPEAQLDRFLLHIRVDYPSENEERDILMQTTGSGSSRVPTVMAGEAVLGLQKLVREVHISPDMLVWINRLVRASRPQSQTPGIGQWVKWGAGPRAGQALVLSAKARALIHGRFAVTEDDVRALAPPVLRHRLLLTFMAEAEQKSADDVVALLLAAVPYPR